jgi:3-oxoacyl-[acyl-carrier protein] reductase
MDFGLKGKKALVCGGSKGLGYGAAEALAKENADVYILGRGEASLNEAVTKLKELGSGDVHSLSCDLVTKEGRDAVIKSIKSGWGGVDILIHNVGGPKPTYVLDTDTAAWQEGFERLFLSVVELNAAFVPGMKEKRWGRVITVTSLSVVEPIQMLAVSNALRSASTAMSKTLSDEVACYGITVNCVAPGSISTDRTMELAKARIADSGQSIEDYQSEQGKSIPVGRVGRSDEYGAVVCFLCSEQASYVTGSTVFVDGGKRRSTY